MPATTALKYRITGFCFKAFHHGCQHFCSKFTLNQQLMTKAGAGYFAALNLIALGEGLLTVSYGKSSVIPSRRGLPLRPHIVKLRHSHIINTFIYLFLQSGILAKRAL